MQNKPNLLSARMNTNPAITKDYENIPPAEKCENKPNQTQFQPKNEANKPNRTQFQPKNEADKPNQTQFYLADSKAKKMLMHLTINARREAFGYDPDEIEVAKGSALHYWTTGTVLWSRKPSSLRALTGCCNFRMAFASTCLTRSRVTLKILPTSSSV